MDNNTVQQVPYTGGVVPVPTTTFAITTTTCGGGTVASHAIARTICNGDTYVAIGSPEYKLMGCPDSTFAAYRITQLPNNTGKLQVNGVDLTLNQDLTKAQMAAMVYKLTDASISSDNAKFTVRITTSGGVITSSAYNIDITVIDCNNDGCVDCGTTTTQAVTTTTGA